MGKKAVHIFHHNDLDGRAAGGLWFEYFDRYRDDIEMYFMHEVDYTMKLDTEIHDGDIIVFVDYSFSSMENIEYLKNLISNGFTIYWIGHHKTSQALRDELAANCYDTITYKNFRVFINTNFCATYWSYCFIMEMLLNKINFVIPEVIYYVDSYDCWKFNMPNTREFHYGMLGTKYTARNFFRNQVFKCDKSCNIFVYGEAERKREAKFISKTISNGTLYKKYDEIMSVKQREACGFVVCITDTIAKKLYIGYAMNIRGNSFVFGDLFDKYDFVMPFIHNSNHIWKYSIYSSMNVDCEYLARMFGKAYKLGGGGHKNAAGFQSNECIFDNGNIFTIKKPWLKKEPVLVCCGFTDDSKK